MGLTTRTPKYVTGPTPARPFNRIMLHERVVAYFLPFFFRMLPLSVTAGPPLSTNIASSSLLTLLTGVLAGVVKDLSVSNSFMNSDWIEARRFSHHCFSDSVWA
jgi:hypothetical protein